MLNRALGKSQTHSWGAIQDGSGGLVDAGDPRYLTLWKSYFKDLGNPKPLENLPEGIKARRAQISDAVENPRFWETPGDLPHAVQQLNVPLTEEEVDLAVSQLPMGKAAGPDGFSNEILKAVGTAALLPILGRLWDEEVHPDQWNLSTIVPLAKGGDATKLSNTRGISLMSHVCKMYGSILNRRLVKYMEGQKKLIAEQGGFRPEKACSDHIFVLHETLRRRKLSQQSSFLLFVDLSKAYDRVWRTGLVYKLARLGVQGKMLRVLHDLYQRTSAVVRVNGETSGEFELEVGVRQGDVLSPLLFDAFINDLVQPLKDMGIGVGVPGLPARVSPFDPQLDKFLGQLWADDVVFVGESVGQLREALRVVDEWCQTWGMAVNAAKCGLMVVSPDPGEVDAFARGVARGPFVVQGESIPVVSEYKYLGVIFSQDLLWVNEIQQRAVKVRDAIFRHARVLRDSRLTVTVRRHLLSTKILPVAHYACEIWGTDEKACAPVEAVLSTAYRMVLGASGAAARVALAWELGLAPLHVTAQKRRVCHFLKLLRGSDSTAHKWCRSLLHSQHQMTTKSWLWRRRCVRDSLALGVSEAELGRLTGNHTLWEQLKKRVKGNTDKIAMQYFRKKCEVSPGWLSVYPMWHDGEETLSTPEYFRAQEFIKGNQVLFAIRAGSLFLNDRVSKVAPERGMMCRSCSEAAIETPEHFMRCPALEHLRMEWAATHAEVAQDPVAFDTIVHGPLQPLWLFHHAGPLPSCRAALEPSPASSPLFPGLSEASSQTLIKARAKALMQMWQKRNSILGVALEPSAQGKSGSGVKAFGTTEQIEAIHTP